MDVRTLTVVGVMAMTLAIAGLTACTPRAPQEAGTGTTADAERTAHVQRAEAFRRDAKNIPALTPDRKVELQQLATDVRAWQARTNREDVRVTRDSINAARRNDSPGGGDDGCDDCPGYTLDGDKLCFLEDEGECPAGSGQDLDFGRMCVYTCIWIGAEAEPAGKAP